MVAYTYYESNPRVKKEAEALVEAGFDVDFLSLKRIGENSFQKVNGVNVFRLNCQHFKGRSNIKYLLSYINFFIRVFFIISYLYFKKKYKIIHINNMPDLLVFAALVPRIFGAKLILDIHDTMSETFSTKFKKNSNLFLFKILLFQERISVNFVNSVISVHYPQENEILVKYGIFIDNFFSESYVIKYFNNKVYPIDIYSYTAGIITLVRLKEAYNGRYSMYFL